MTPLSPARRHAPGRARFRHRLPSIRRAAAAVAGLSFLLLSPVGPAPAAEAPTPTAAPPAAPATPPAAPVPAPPVAGAAAPRPEAEPAAPGAPPSFWEREFGALDCHQQYNPLTYLDWGLAK
ncbi:MAG: hypothetical protein HY719_04740, partial [Planctomycetes bacterium]|nr:hypothetical protein [Planctomycetota bacterium]